MAQTSHGITSSPPARDELDELCDQIDAGNVGLVQGADLMEAMLTGKGMLWQEYVDPAHVGFHPENRDK